MVAIILSDQGKIFYMNRNNNTGKKTLNIVFLHHIFSAYVTSCCLLQISHHLCSQSDEVASVVVFISLSFQVFCWTLAAPGRAPCGPHTSLWTPCWCMWTTDGCVQFVFMVYCRSDLYLCVCVCVVSICSFVVLILWLNLLTKTRLLFIALRDSSLYHFILYSDSLHMNTSATLTVNGWWNNLNMCQLMRVRTTCFYLQKWEHLHKAEQQWFVLQASDMFVLFQVWLTFV